MSAQLSMTIETNRDELARIVTALEEFGEQESWAPDLFFRVNLVIEEWVLNVMDYGFDGPSGDERNQIELTLTSEPDTLTIEIVDGGKPFDPLHDAPEPDTESSIEDRPVGGLGVYMVRTMMDQTHYRREEGRNHLTLVARRD